MFDKIKNYMDDRKRKKNIILKGEIYSNTIYTNDLVDIIYHACKECYKGKIDQDWQIRLDYIKDKVKMGHESVLEHSNIVTIYHFSVNYFKELLDILSVCKYVVPKIIYNNDNTITLVLSSSVRGYKYIFRNIKDLNNRICQQILSEMYNMPSCFFTDMINDGIMTMDKFLDEGVETVIHKINDIKEDSNVDIYNIDDINMLHNLLPELPINDLLDICSITIYIKDITRAISMQCNRHECGISQASQRYIDISSHMIFHSPDEFKPNKYPSDKLYEISFQDKDKANPIPFKFTLQELGQQIMKVYPQLKDQGLLKEDARGYLPNNTTTSEYMTFTFKNFINFLYLRTSERTQAENRKMALDLEGRFISLTNGILTKDNIYKYLDPVYKQEFQNNRAYDEVDEIIK